MISYDLRYLYIRILYEPCEVIKIIAKNMKKTSKQKIIFISNPIYYIYSYNITVVAAENY